ncbi:hypothetical protein UFOVP84_75 [uncultured Caudovirales phage]|uniref:Peptidase n=1 Tax=uncultured Caudovirales phage TaxID=2100421 RepID=A0A6J5L5P7_9CAUD|nr:hypothetical protein UFOVP84_75 [uncultured Caudovirales phage]
MKNVIDLTAKLLANENITVIKAAVKTASFNVETRQLTLPVLKGTTSEIEQMLVSHEVSHALFTTQDMVEASIGNRRLHGYLNVCEDVRAEKLMKRKYPGTRKIFAEGYKQLNERDFFKIKNIPDINKLNLIDRINMHFKLGSHISVNFDKTEREFVTRVETTETSLDVIRLASEIFEYSKAQKNKETTEEQEQDQPEQPNPNQDAEEIEEESEEQESEEQESESESEEQESEEDLDSITDSALSESIQDLADTSVNYQYHTIDNDYQDGYIVGYKTVLEELAHTETESMLNRDGYTWKSFAPEFDRFKAGAVKSVSYLLKEFEMRKAATAYNRSKVSKSGSLDMKKLWGYQLNDDMFKRVTTVTNGKNHGMVFLLDWSGSMNMVIHDAIEQVITLSMFCHRAQIPFQVFAFTDSYVKNDPLKPQMLRSYTYEKWKAKHNTLDNVSPAYSLFELFSNKMTQKDFNAMSKIMFNTYAVTSFAPYRLGGTPLNHTLAFMTDYIGRFTRVNNIEKVSFITLTDGQGEGLNSSSNSSSYGYQQTKNFIVDNTTKKTYEFNKDAVGQTSTLLQIIKDRYNTTNVGFYISNSTTANAIGSAIYYNGVSKADANIDDIRVQARKTGFATLKSPGRDELFLVPAKSLHIEDKELEISSNASTKSIANKFSKTLESQQVNRLLLNNFVKMIA